MLHTMTFLLTWLGNLSVMTAIGFLGYYIGFALVRLFEGGPDVSPKAENCAWFGLLFFGLWMACEVGRIGL